MSERILTFTDALREAMQTVMAADESVMLIGEGVPDPKGIFGTTLGLQEEFGSQRVFDMPLSENGMTGICLGAAQAGMRPVMIHQRVDFLLLAMDQIINIAAKWRFLFGEGAELPVVIRTIVGRGWGQGPQHSQSLQALFAHIPGLRVVMPATARDAKGMMIAAVEDNNPVIFIEHRWLHNTQDHVPAGHYLCPLEGAEVRRQGVDVTIVAFSLMVVEALRASQWLESQNIHAEVIDMRVARPLDMNTVVASVNKTGRVLVLDTAWRTGGLSAEIIAGVSEQAFGALKTAPSRLAMPDQPVPTAPSLTESMYPEAEDIAAAVLELMGMDEKQARKDSAVLIRTGDRDVPNQNFTGPF